MIHDTIISIRSLVWPGMYYIAKDEFTSSLYIGDGHKYTSSLFFPKFPYLISVEPETKVEHVEVR